MIIKNKNLIHVIKFTYFLLPLSILAFLIFSLEIAIISVFLLTVGSLMFVFDKPNAITLWPFILMYGAETKTLVRHETYHLKQQLGLLVVFFYIIYIANFLINYIKYQDYEIAYYNIIFEREAFLNQRKRHDIPYYGWIKYWKNYIE